MQHAILVLAIMLLIAIATKEHTVAKEATVNRLMQNEKVQGKQLYELPDEEDDVYNTEFNVGSCYTYLFQ
jgi:hypothetical protein